MEVTSSSAQMSQ